MHNHEPGGGFRSDLADGALACCWPHEPEPAVGPDAVYIPSGEDARLFALRPADGKKIRSFAIETGFVPAIMTDGRVIVSEVRNLALGAVGVPSVAAFSAQGKKLWRTKVGRASDYYSVGISDPVVAAHGTVYVGRPKATSWRFRPTRAR
jgi:outer membrane protein assembly factor BamB